MVNDCIMARWRQTSARMRLYRGLMLWLLVGALVLWGFVQALRVRQAVLAKVQLQGRDKSARHPSKASVVVQPSHSASFLQRVYIGNVASNTHAPSGTVLSTADTGDDTLEVISPDLLAKTARNVKKADEYLAAGQILQARELYNSALHGISGLGEHEAHGLRQDLAQLNAHTLLGTGVLPDDPAASIIAVTAGDTLGSIADNYRLTLALIEELNPAVHPADLRAGQPVKVLLGPFDARVVLHAHRIDIMLHHLYVTSFKMQLDDTLPVNPGVYEATLSRESDVNVWPQGAIRVNPRRGHGRGLMIQRRPAAVGNIGVSGKVLARLQTFLSPKYSQVDVVP